MFEVKITRKKIKNIYIKIKKDGIVYINTPYKTTDKFIEKIIQGKRDWILQNLEKFKNLPKIDENFISLIGTKFEILRKFSKDEKIILNDNKFEIYTKFYDDDEKVAKIIYNYKMKFARECYEQILNKYLNLTNNHINLLKIREMKTRWGSCSFHKKQINLNLNLIKYPKECIEFVIMHEISHLVHPNHSKKFYEYFETYMPDWKQRKKMLESLN